MMLIAGPKIIQDRGVIVDALIDYLCDHEVEKIITGDSFGVDQIISELVNSYTDIEYERIYPDFNKFGKHAKIRSLWKMTSKSTHLLLFDDQVESVYDVMYFANRHNLVIKRVQI